MLHAYVGICLLRTDSGGRVIISFSGGGFPTLSEPTAIAGGTSPQRPVMGVFERFLTLWVALCIVAGVVFGQLVPGVFHALGDATVAQVNLPVAVLVWLMIIPMLLKIDLAALREVGQHWRGIATTVGINWLVKPFSMALLGWLFIAHLFRPLSAGRTRSSSYIAGLILLAAAPCTAMVFVWSNLVDGEPHFTLTGRAQRHDHGRGVRADRRRCCSACPRSPCRGTRCSCPSSSTSSCRSSWRSSGGARCWRAADRRHSPARCARLAPLSLSALLLTLVLLFGLQGEQIIRQPLVIVLLAVPILIQVYFNAGLAYWLNRALGVEWCVAGPSALIGASNFFELAVATAIVLFGFQSGAALATVVGVLVEVPVMLSVVHIVRRSRAWYERG